MGRAEAMLSNIIETWPPATSCNPGGLPLYGTCCICTPAIALNISPAKCWELPLPAEA